MLKNRLSRQPGFTLLELLVVCVIIAIVVGQAVPSYINWHQQASTRQTAKAIMLLLQQAQNQAIAQGRNSLVKLSPGLPGCVAMVAEPACLCQTPDCAPGQSSSIFLQAPLSALQLARPNQIEFSAFTGLSQGTAGSIIVGRSPYLIRIVVNNLGRQRWCTLGSSMAGIASC